jgi:hypothetical protein
MTTDVPAGSRAAVDCMVAPAETTMMGVLTGPAAAAITAAPTAEVTVEVRAATGDASIDGTSEDSTTVKVEACCC